MVEVARQGGLAGMVEDVRPGQVLVRFDDGLRSWVPADQVHGSSFSWRPERRPSSIPPGSEPKASYSGSSGTFSAQQLTGSSVQAGAVQAGAVQAGVRAEPWSNFPAALGAVAAPHPPGNPNSSDPPRVVADPYQALSGARATTGSFVGEVPRSQPAGQTSSFPPASSYPGASAPGSLGAPRPSMHSISPYLDPEMRFEITRPEAGLGWLLFRFDGRLPRKPFWLANLVLLAGPLLIGLLIGIGFDLIPAPWEPGDAEPAGRFDTVVGSLLMLLTLGPGLWGLAAVHVKRWHDRDKEAYWMLAWLVPILGQVWALVESGFLPGTAGSNRFGDDPLVPPGL